MYSQCLQVSLLFLRMKYETSMAYFIRLVTSLCGVWNLEFFHYTFLPFCISPHLKLLHVFCCFFLFFLSVLHLHFLYVHMCMSNIYLHPAESWKGCQLSPCLQSMPTSLRPWLACLPSERWGQHKGSWLRMRRSWMSTREQTLEVCHLNW